MSLFPSRIPDIDITYLNNLADRDLANACVVDRYTYQLCQSESFWNTRIRTRLGMEYIAAKPDYLTAREWYNFWMAYPYTEDVIAQRLKLTLFQAYLRRVTLSGVLEIGSEAFIGSNISFPLAISADDEIYTYFTEIYQREKYRFHNYLGLFKALLENGEDITELANKTILEHFTPDMYKRLGFMLAYHKQEEQYHKIANTSMYSSSGKFFLNEGYIGGLVALHDPGALTMLNNSGRSRDESTLSLTLISIAIKYDNWDFFGELIKDIHPKEIKLWIIKRMIKYGKADYATTYFPDIELYTGQIFTNLVNAGRLDEAKAYAKSKKNKLSTRDNAMSELLKTCDSEIIDIFQSNKPGSLHVNNISIKDCTAEQIKHIISYIKYNDIVIGLILRAILKGNYDVIPVLVERIKNSQDLIFDLLQYLCRSDNVDIAVYVALVYYDTYQSFPAVANLTQPFFIFGGQYYLTLNQLRNFEIVNRKIISIIEKLASGDSRSFYDLSVGY